MAYLVFTASGAATFFGNVLSGKADSNTGGYSLTNSTAGSAEITISPPVGTTLSADSVTVPDVTTTLAGLAVAQIFSQEQTISIPAATATLAMTNSAGTCTHTPGSSSETVSCSSDKKFKSNIKSAWLSDYMSGWLWDFPVRKYTWNATGKRVIGVVAQELQKIHPDMVHEETANDGSHYLAVDEPNVWRLVLAIQELQAFAALVCVVTLLSWVWHLWHWHRHHRGRSNM